LAERPLAARMSPVVRAAFVVPALSRCGCTPGPIAGGALGAERCCKAARRIVAEPVPDAERADMTAAVTRPAPTDEKLTDLLELIGGAVSSTLDDEELAPRRLRSHGFTRSR
jgi:hypothetical protein